MMRWTDGSFLDSRVELRNFCNPNQHPLLLLVLPRRWLCLLLHNPFPYIGYGIQAPVPSSSLSSVLVGGARLFHIYLFAVWLCVLISLDTFHSTCGARLSEKVPFLFCILYNSAVYALGEGERPKFYNSQEAPCMPDHFPTILESFRWRKALFNSLPYYFSPFSPITPTTPSHHPSDETTILWIILLFPGATRRLRPKRDREGVRIGALNTRFIKRLSGLLSSCSDNRARNL